MAFVLMRLNFVHPDPTDAQHMSDRYRAGVELAEYGDTRGLAMVTTEEHQATPMGWSPTPLLTASTILSRTTNLSVAISALLVPLHDPVRLAQQIAVIDLMSKGRLSVCTGLGYRPTEYAVLGKEWRRRGRLLDEALDTMMAIWSGEPVEVNGETIQVGPMPWSRPHPPLLIGGSSPAAAKRAARLGLPLQLPGPNPEVQELYESLCAEAGTSPFCIAPTDVAMVQVVEDPERAWAELGEHFLFEATAYHSWQPPGQDSAVHSGATTVDELRAEGIYKFLTPEQAVDRIRSHGMLALHPLCGGMPIDAAWQSMELVCDRVLPAATAE